VNLAVKDLSSGQAVRAANESAHEFGQLLSQRPYALQALGKAHHSAMQMGGEAIQLLHFVKVL